MNDCVVIKRLQIPAVVCMVDVMGTILFSQQFHIDSVSFEGSKFILIRSGMKLNQTTSKNVSDWVVCQLQRKHWWKPTVLFFPHPAAGYFGKLNKLLLSL